MIRYIYFILFCSFVIADSYNMQLLGYLSYGQQTSDITGFYQDGREFAVIGLQNTTSFVDVTDPASPFEVGRIDGSNSIWRDLKYWDRHVYIGTEADDGIKVVNVDDPDNPVLVHTITDVDNSHNIHVDDGYLYMINEKTFGYWSNGLLERSDYSDDRESAGTASWWIDKISKFGFELMEYKNASYTWRKII